MAKRLATQQHYQEKLNHVLLYIQEHLDESLEVEELARVAAFSPYHFHRMFSAMVGESLHQYIRRERLERAAGALQKASNSITQVALEAGFQTPSAFAKAFKQHFGQTPSQFRTQQWERYQAQRSSFEETYQGEFEDIEIRRQDLPTRQVWFIRKMGTYAQIIPEAWKTMGEFLQQQPPVEAQHRLGIYHDNPNISEPNRCGYDACIWREGELLPQGEIGVQTLPGGLFAIFSHVGSYRSLGRLYWWIFAHWLQKQSFSLRDAVQFERYLDPNPLSVHPDQLRTEIYLPIRS